LTLALTVIASILAFVPVGVVPLVWTFAFVSNFFVGGCLIMVLTLLGWNTNQSNAPVWFGLLGSVRGVVIPYNFDSFFYDFDLGRLIVFIGLWCIALVLFVWVLISNLSERSRVLMPYYLNYGQQVVFTHQLWSVYLGQSLVSVFIMLYGYMLIGYVVHYETATEDVSFYKYNSLSVGCALVAGGLGIVLHHWG